MIRSLPQTSEMTLLVPLSVLLPRVNRAALRPPNTAAFSGLAKALQTRFCLKHERLFHSQIGSFAFSAPFQGTALQVPCSFTEHRFP